MLDSCQHGFQKGWSTVTNLLQCDKCLANYLNQGISCDLIMIALSRAFNRVDRNILYAKLKDLGIGGCYLKRISKNLSNRKQYVICNNAPSELSDVPSVVVQGNAIKIRAFSFLSTFCPRLSNMEYIPYCPL